MKNPLTVHLTAIHTLLQYLKSTPGQCLSFLANKKCHLSTYHVRNPSMSLSLKLSRNEKVEHHIRKKTHKHITLRF